MDKKLTKGQLLIENSSIGTNAPQICVVQDTFKDGSISLRHMHKGVFTIDPSKGLEQFSYNTTASSESQIKENYSPFFPMFAGSSAFEFTQPGTKLKFNNKIYELLIKSDNEDLNEYNRYDIKFDSEIIGYFFNEETCKFEIAFSTPVPKANITKPINNDAIASNAIITKIGQKNTEKSLFSIPLDQLNSYIFKNQYKYMNHNFDESNKQYSPTYFVINDKLVESAGFCFVSAEELSAEFTNNSFGYPIQVLFDCVINLFDSHSDFSLGEIDHLIVPIFKAFASRDKKEEFFDYFLSLKSLSKLRSETLAELAQSFKGNKKTEYCLTDRILPNSYIEKLTIDDVHNTITALWLKLLSLNNAAVKNEKYIERTAANLYKIFSYAKEYYYNDDILAKLNNHIKNNALSSKRYFKLIDGRVWDKTQLKNSSLSISYEDENELDEEDDGEYDEDDEYYSESDYDDEDYDEDDLDEEDESEHYENLANDLHNPFKNLKDFVISIEPLPNGQIKFNFSPEKITESEKPLSNNSLKFGDFVNVPMKNPYNYSSGFISREDQMPADLMANPIAAFEHLKLVGVSSNEYYFEVKPEVVSQFANPTPFLSLNEIKSYSPGAVFDKKVDVKCFVLPVDKSVIHKIGLPLDTSVVFANPQSVRNQPFNFFSDKSLVPPKDWFHLGDIGNHPAKEQPSSVVNKQTVATLESGIFNMLKSDAKSSAYRIAAEQVKKLTKATILNFVSKSNASQASAWSILLDTDIGDVFVFELLGYTLTYAPKIKDHHAVQELAKELRISGMATAGNIAASSLIKSILPGIGDVINNLPMLAESRAEAENLAVNQEQVILENVSFASQA